MDNTFPKSAEQLLNYMEMQKRVMSGLVLYKHVAMLAYIAGWDMSEFSAHSIRTTRRIVALRHYDTEGLFRDAGERIRKGIVRRDWKRSFEALFAQNDTRTVIPFSRKRAAPGFGASAR